MANYVPVSMYPNRFPDKNYTFRQGVDLTASDQILGGGDANNPEYPLFTATRDMVIDQIILRATTVESAASKTIAFFKAPSGTALASGTQVTTYTAVTSNATVAPGKAVAAANTNKTLVAKDYTGAFATGSQTPANEGIMSSTNVSGTVVRNRNVIKAGETFGFVTFDGSTPSSLALQSLENFVVTITGREARS